MKNPASPLSATRRWKWSTGSALLVIAVAGTAYESGLQAEEQRFVSVLAQDIVRTAGARTDLERVIALRDYLRANVSHVGAPKGDNDRPFLRATTSETIKTGLGFCGEVSRAFINLAWALGIPAQRINLYGPKMHVVAEVELQHRQRLVVDAQNPPQIEELESLDRVMTRPDYDDYYTLNLRRLHLGWLVSRIRFEIGPITYLAENPHLLKATLWAALLLLLLGFRLLRYLLPAVLHQRGWVRRSSLADLDTLAPQAAPSISP
jgi:hypothetical protein